MDRSVFLAKRFLQLGDIAFNERLEIADRLKTLDTQQHGVYSAYNQTATRLRDVQDNWTGCRVRQPGRSGRASDEVTAFWIGDQMQAEGSRLAFAYPTGLEYDREGEPAFSPCGETG